VTHSRSLLQQESSSTGGYGGYGSGEYSGYGGYGGSGGTRRRLIQGGYGGYGGYGSGEYGGYGGASGPRLLLEEDTEVVAAAAANPVVPKQAKSTPPVTSIDVRRAEQQREAASTRHASDREQPVSAAMAAALRNARAVASSALSAPPGQCYCRFDADYNTWALGEEPCKQALYIKCRADQLSCGWMDAYYNHAAGSLAHTLPHEQDILSFVFDDCQPHPPCACAGVKFDGGDSGELTGLLEESRKPGVLECALPGLPCKH